MNIKNPEDKIPKPVNIWVSPVDAEEFKAKCTEEGRTQRDLFAEVWEVYNRTMQALSKNGELHRATKEH